MSEEPSAKFRSGVLGKDSMLARDQNFDLLTAEALPMGRKYTTIKKGRQLGNALVRSFEPKQIRGRPLFDFKVLTNVVTSDRGEVGHPLLDRMRLGQTALEFSITGFRKVCGFFKKGAFVFA